MIKKWWQAKTVYQIYPKSFCDLNGDGIGDINGIISKLDYLKDLGIDIVWLSPCYCSPMSDQGYDISDYYNIDPMFGTMEDFDRLLSEAKKRGIGIVMDLVVNHCSDEHEWFKKAVKDPSGKYAKYFYIEDSVNGGEPNNWRSYFGGSAWQKIPGTEKYYLHLFNKKQPDLNWENEELREEIYKMINWWLDKGLAGFRIDAIMNIKKALPVTDYNFPPDRDDGLCNPRLMLQEAKGLGELLSEIRKKTFLPHNSFTVGEVTGDNDSVLGNFIGDNGYFSTMFDFRTTEYAGSENGWYDNKKVTLEDYKRCCFKTQKTVGDIGFVSNIIENHDQPRGVSHYIKKGEVNDTSKKLLAAMMFMIKGIPFIYEGQEIGMENTTFNSIDEIDDISSQNEYKVAIKAGLSEKEALEVVSKFSRDNTRTPFQWNSEKNAGFTTGKPWLKVNPNYKRINAENEIHDENSVFAFYKKLIALRKSKDYGETVVYGKFEAYLEETKGLMAFFRLGENKTLLVLGNLENTEKTVELPKALKTVIINNCNDLKHNDKAALLSGYQAIVAEI